MEQNEVQSKPLSNIPLSNMEDEHSSSYKIAKSQPRAVQNPGMKKVTKKKVISAKGVEAGQQRKSLEEKINDFLAQEKAAAVSDPEIRVLRVKLHIMQEELDLLSSDYHEKDDEIAKLCAKNEELQDDRDKLQRTINIQKTQIEEQKASARKFAQKCDALQQQVSALSKLVRSYEEEVEKMTCQLSKTKLINTNTKSEEHPNVENLLTENKMLKKQKTELVVGLKKQAMLIDILKRQKMHLEAAKLLSFTEEEFLKAMDLETQ
ncbi:hypothetical protein XENORESO_020341 [Xenotaenia resolanae]|uniref:Testis expressed 9 n=1 Tax=Xenotaenia resolanae TaxID=208358 RepID=A0ABV0WJ43_9TELE